MGGNELKYVQQAFLDNWLSSVGPNLNKLEKFVSINYRTNALALTSGTSAIHLALKILGLKPGDEVVVPTLTFVAGCNPVLYEGAHPVFIDSERESWNLDPNLLELFLKRRAKINRLPRIVTVTHLFGQSANVECILKLCSNYQIPVIEDAAESLGSNFKDEPTGTFGDFGVYSFNGNKMITASSGGMLISKNSSYIEKARYLSTQARDPDPNAINNYIHSQIGYNYRMSNVLAGIALGQFEVLEERVQLRQKVFNRYVEDFSSHDGIIPQPQAIWANHSRWLSCFLIDEKKFGVSQKSIINYLKSQNIESRPVWKPMHLQPLFNKYEYIGGNVAEDLNRRGICLPSSSSLSEEDQQRVIDCVKSLHTSLR